MASIWKAGKSRNPVALGEPACSYAPGNRNNPDEYNFSLRDPKEGKHIYITITEFELRKMIEDWKGLTKGTNDDAFINTLPNCSI